MTNARTPVSFLATANPDATRDFYTEVLGLTLRETSPFALVFEDEKHGLRIQIVEDFVPAPFTVYGWQVSSIADEIATLASKDVEFLAFEHLLQDSNGTWTSPDGHKIAWFRDPSGNILSLTEVNSI